MNRRSFLQLAAATPLTIPAAVMSAKATAGAGAGDMLPFGPLPSGFQRKIWPDGRWAIGTRDFIKRMDEAYIPLPDYRELAAQLSSGRTDCRRSAPLEELRCAATAEHVGKINGDRVMPSSTLQKLRAILSEFLGVDESDVTPGSDLLDLGVDSLDKVELTFAIEQEFDIEITQDEVEDIQTVGDIISLVDNIKRSAA